MLQLTLKRENRDCAYLSSNYPSVTLVLARYGAWANICAYQSISTGNSLKSPLRTTLHRYNEIPARVTGDCTAHANSPWTPSRSLAYRLQYSE